jgi:hypothetical protein
MNAARELLDAADDRLDRVRSAYASDGEHPIGSYGVLLSVYGAMAAALGTLTVRRRGLPQRFAGRDYLLLAVATHKLSRLVTKDAVGAAVRAPFTGRSARSRTAPRFEDAVGEG